MTEKQIISKAMSALGKRSVEKRLPNTTPKQRSEHMKRVRAGQPLGDKSKTIAKKAHKIRIK